MAGSGGAITEGVDALDAEPGTTPGTTAGAAGRSVLDPAGESTGAASAGLIGAGVGIGDAAGAAAGSARGFQEGAGTVAEADEPGAGAVVPSSPSTRADGTEKHVCHAAIAPLRGVLG